MVPLAQLGFDVWGFTAEDPAAARARLGDVLGREEAEQRITSASPDALAAPDDWAHWVVLALDGIDPAAALAEAARVLQPGGWVWVETMSGAAHSLDAAAEAAGLVVAEAVGQEGDRAHAIYRKPGAVG